MGTVSHIPGRSSWCFLLVADYVHAGNKSISSETLRSYHLYSVHGGQHCYFGLVQDWDGLYVLSLCPCIVPSH